MTPATRLGWSRGDTIFRSVSPWVSVLLSPYRGLRCDLCHLPGPLPGPDLSCPDCGLVFYCSCDCQDNDPDHGAECEVLARAGALPARNEVRVVVRAVAKLQGGGGERETWLLHRLLNTVHTEQGSITLAYKVEIIIVETNDTG